MTKAFTALIAALAITATLAIDTSPAQAWSFGVEAPATVSGTDLGSGRVNGVSGLDLGSSR